MALGKQQTFDRIAEAGSWRGLALAFAAAIFAAPEFLDGSLRMDQADWRAVFLFLCIVCVIISFALPEPHSKTTVVVQPPCPPGEDDVLDTPQKKDRST